MKSPRTRTRTRVVRDFAATSSLHDKVRSQRATSRTRLARRSWRKRRSVLQGRLVLGDDEIVSTQPNRSKRDEHGRMVVDATELAANRHPGKEMMDKKRGVMIIRIRRLGAFKEEGSGDEQEAWQNRKYFYAVSSYRCFHQQHARGLFSRSFPVLLPFCTRRSASTPRTGRGVTRGTAPLPASPLTSCALQLLLLSCMARPSLLLPANSPRPLRHQREYSSERPM